MSELRRLTNINEQLCFKEPLTKAGEGTVVAIVVDGEMLATQGISAIRMQGYMDKEAIELTMQDAIVTFYSRSRQELWHKGETSGNLLKVRDAYEGSEAVGLAIYVDCDGDSLVIDAQPIGPTCHTGASSCFTYQSIGE
jgi:phosphoribosyl-AMP cyclohydrolase / phosphoribosyl-ATP pyrophosphohydrolase